MYIVYIVGSYFSFAEPHNVMSTKPVIQGVDLGNVLKSTLNNWLDRHHCETNW